MKIIGFDDIHKGSGIRVGHADSTRGAAYRFGIDHAGRFAFCDRRVEDQGLPEGTIFWLHIRTPPRALVLAVDAALNIKTTPRVDLHSGRKARADASARRMSAAAA